jgi:hypothetical protein
MRAPGLRVEESSRLLPWVQDVGHHIARSVHGQPGTMSCRAGEPTLEDLQRSLGEMVQGPGAAPPVLHTSEGHPIHLAAAAHDLEHHAMSPAGHKEAGEVLRQAVKLLLHLRDVKRGAGDTKGALLFDREAKQLLERMKGHQAVGSHKEAMDQHAASAAAHGAHATEVARQIAGKDDIGLADHAQARAHPLFPRYAAERHAEQRASDGVRHAGLAAMGRAGKSAHSLELNQFLGQHGHDAHGLSDEGEDAHLVHDPEKARVAKTLTGPPSVHALGRTRISAIGARGGRARNQGGAQKRAPSPADPAQVTGQTVPTSRVVEKGTSPADELRKALAESHLAAASDAASQGDSDTMLHHAITAMEHALTASQVAGTASRDGDGDGRVDGPDDGDADGDATDPVSPVAKALVRRPLRPNLDRILHRPGVRAPESPLPAAGRILRRYPTGELDFEGAKHAILDALGKLGGASELTPIERALASLVLPPGTMPDRGPGQGVALGRITDEEKRRLTSLVIGHMLEVARADGERALARSATTWSLPEVQKHLARLLVADPLGLGTAAVVKAAAPAEIETPPVSPKGGAGSRGGQVAYATTSGRPVYASHARRLAPQMGRMMEQGHHRAAQSGHPEDHAVAAKQALASAFYHHHAGDSVAAEQALGYAEHHLGKARELGHQGRTMRWLDRHHPQMTGLLLDLPT